MQEIPLEFTSVCHARAIRPLQAITPPEMACMHTYYDLCPWSPSGRYVACLRLPVEDRPPHPGEKAELCVIDLSERVLRVVATTAGWGHQTGAHQQWGQTDRYLYFNDMDEDRPVGVRLDLTEGTRTVLEGPIWQVSPDKSGAICTCLNRGRLTQEGYGVTVRPDAELVNTTQASADDGLYRVDLQTGGQSLLVSLEDIWAVLDGREDLAGSTLYAFHCKYNPAGDRIMIVVRARWDDGRYAPSLVTCRADGSNLRNTVPHRLWRRGGHHPIWHPNGREVLMNLTPGEEMRFCLIDAETAEVTVLLDDPPGSGHPSISSNGRWLLTDVTGEDDGIRTATVRLVDLASGAYSDLCSLTSPAVGGSPLRRDAHPVWSRDEQQILFLAAPEGRRQLFIADAFVEG